MVSVSKDSVPCYDLYPVPLEDAHSPPGGLVHASDGVYYCPGDWVVVDVDVDKIARAYKHLLVPVAVNVSGFTMPSGETFSKPLDLSNPTVEYCLYPNKPLKVPVVAWNTNDLTRDTVDRLVKGLKDKLGLSVQIDPYSLDYYTSTEVSWVGPVGVRNAAPGPDKAGYFDRVDTAEMIRACFCTLVGWYPTPESSIEPLDPHPSWLCIVDSKLATRYVDPDKWVKGDDWVHGAALLAYDLIFSVSGRSSPGKPPGIYVEPGAAVVFDGSGKYRMGVEWAQVVTVEEGEERGWLGAKLEYLRALKEVPCDDRLATAAARFLLNADDLFSGLINRLKEVVKGWSQEEVDSFWERLGSVVSAVPGSVPQLSVDSGGSLDYLVASARLADPVEYTYSWEAGSYFVIAVVGHWDGDSLVGHDVVAGCKVWGIRADPGYAGTSSIRLLAYPNPDDGLGRWFVDRLDPSRLADVIVGLVAAEGASLAILWKYAASGRYTVRVVNPGVADVTSKYSVGGVSGAVVEVRTSPVREDRFYWPWEVGGLVQPSETEVVALQSYDPPSYETPDGRRVVGPVARILRIGEVIGKSVGAGIVSGWGAGVV